MKTGQPSRTAMLTAAMRHRYVEDKRLIPGGRRTP
jgi:hypothetical protein